MNIWLALPFALLLGGCGSSTNTSADRPKNTAPSSTLTCKAVIDHVRQMGKFKSHDLTMAIGECEEQNWPVAARSCITGAASLDELGKCAHDFKLPITGLVPADVRLAQAMNQMRVFANQMCACHDTACAQNVSEAMAKWSQREAKESQGFPDMTDEQTRAATQLGERIGKCMQAAMSGGVH